MKAFGRFDDIIRDWLVRCAWAFAFASGHLNSDGGENLGYCGR
jgi:hypothetical protein